MSTGMMIITVTLLILLFLKLPVLVVTLGASAVYFVLTPGINSAVFAQQATAEVESATLLAIPFFVCAEVLMNYTDVTKRIMDFYVILTGRMYGGLSQVNILLSTLMGGLSGSVLADTAIRAKMLVLETERKGINRAFSTVVTAVSSMIIPLIPLGIGLILCSCIANVSIGKLFVAGFGPGVLLCATMMFMVSRISKERGYLPLRTEKMHPFVFWKSFRPAVLLLRPPIIIIGGMRLSVFTAMETGSVAIVYTAILGIVYRELRFKEIAQGLKETLQTVSSIMLIVTAASTFSWILTKGMIPQRLTKWMIRIINNKWTFLVAMNILLTLVGMLVEGSANMIMLVPLLAPVAAVYGIDPIHFTTVFIFANAVGAFTPPMGTLVFVVCEVTKCPTRDLIKEATPLYALSFGCLPALIFVPLFSTGLVDLVY